MITRMCFDVNYRRWTAVFAIVAMLLVSACVPTSAPQAAPEATVAPSEEAPAEASAAPEAGTALPEISITARDFAFDVPAEIPSGWVSLTLTNEGEVNHHGIVMRLLDGVTMDDALAAIADEGDQTEISDLEFFLPDTDPGSSNQATVEMAPGHWLIFSVSMDASTDGEMTPDLARGSIAEFDVVEADAVAAPPEADLTLTISADDFDLPTEMTEGMTAGQHTIQIVNDSGQENGYAFILKMENGATMDDVMAMFDALFSGQEMDMANMPVVRAVGGLMAYNLGDSYYTNVDLTPGDYTVISNINGSEFPYSGLNKSFTVAEDERASDISAETTGEIPAVMIEVSEDGIMVPDTIPGGIVGITFKNTGEQMHSLDIWRIREGHTADEIVAMFDYLKENPDDFFGVFELGSWIHLADGLEPGASQHFYADLGIGDFFVSDDANPDLGPVFFSTTELVGTTEPDATVTVNMADFSYAMPDAIPAGEHWWAFTNSGEQWHLAAIISANPDASLEEIDAVFVDGPPPANAVVEIFGGMPPMSPGERVWLEFDLEPGAYEVVCPLPDVAALMAGGPPLSHLEHGMRHAFTVEN